MRVLRILLLILFIITSLIFGVDQYRLYKDKDSNAPVITASEEVLRLSVNSTDEDLLRGVSAKDDLDGNVTSSLVIAGKSNFIEEGVIRVDYAAFDSHNNVGTYSRKVIFEDYHSPHFSSKEPLVLRSESTQDFSFFHAEDVLNGDISNKIKILSDAYATTSASEYPIEMEVTNSYGDVEKLKLVLEILTSSEYNLQCPALSDYIIYVPLGEEEGERADFRSFITGIRKGDKVLSFEDADFDLEDIEIEEYVDFNLSGVYTVEYNLLSSKTKTAKTKMIVVVTEDF